MIIFTVIALVFFIVVVLYVSNEFDKTMKQIQRSRGE